MRVIFFNIWFAKTGKVFFDFLKRESRKADVFCFSEVSPQNHEEILNTMPDFNGFVSTNNFVCDFDLVYMQTAYVKKNIKVDSNTKIDTFRQVRNDVGFIQALELKIDGRKFFVGNIHGKAKPGNKRDTKERIKQSQIIIDHFSKIKGPKIIGGDFNLLPETKSVAMFEESGYRDLIKEFKIKSTRNNLSWEKFKKTPGYVKQHYADFCFVSHDVHVKGFKVPYTEVSDHLPLILDFEI